MNKIYSILLICQKKICNRRSLTFVILYFLLNFSLIAKEQRNNDNLSIQLNSGSLITAIESLRVKTGINFYYSTSLLKEYKIKGKNFEKKSLDDVLNYLLYQTDLEYSHKTGTVAVRRKQLVNSIPTIEVAEQEQAFQIVQGIIQDSTGLVLERVTIRVKNYPDFATSSDQNGMFILKVPKEAELLLLSLIGYEDLKISIADLKVSPKIVMNVNQSSLDEVVVVGFGTQKKQSLVGAVETVKSSSLKTASSSLTSSFAGKIAGVLAVQKSGEPGSDGATFWIRGVSSFAGNINPLIILDGVEVDMQILNSIPPEVIDQFSVLKDATATALFGTRGANGVMVITTKTGQNLERMNINVRLEGGFSSHTQKMEMADGVTYMNMFNEALKAREINNNYRPMFTEEKINGTIQKLDPYVYPNVDWYSSLFKPNTYNQNANINVTGGASKINYFINGSLFNENGLFKTIEDRYDNNIKHRRYNLQSNLTANITKNTTLGVKVNAIFRELHGPSASTSSLYYSTLTAPPVRFPLMFPALDGEDYTLFGTASGPYAQGYYPNPYADLVKGYRESFNTTTLGIIDLTQNLNFLTKGLKFKALASFNNYANTSVTRSFKPHYFTLDKWALSPEGDYTYSLANIGEPGQTALSTGSSSNGKRKFNLQASFDYNTILFDKHNINAMFLYHQNQYNNNSPDNNLLSVLPQREQGLAGRFTYNFDNRYFMEFNFGYNGSENFIKGKRFGFFPSIAGGYVISNEQYFKELAGFVTLLKVRGSYGLVGNDKINSRFPYITNVNLNSKSYTFGYDFNNSLAGPNVTLIGNEQAKWEIGKKSNLGIELELDKSFMLIADVFREDRSNIFMQRRIIPSHLGMGAILPYANIGKVRNQGVDMTAEFNKVINQSWSMSTRGTFTYIVNKLMDRDEPIQQEPYLSEIGQPLNSYRGLIAEGLFSSQEEIDSWARSTYKPNIRPGDIKYRDLNNDNVIDDNDKMVIGNPSVPQIIYGAGASITYKNVGLSFNFQGLGKVSLAMSDFHPFDKNEHNVMKFISEDYWKEDNPNTNAKYPRLDNEANSHNRQNSTFWLRDASFVRLKDVEVSYSFKKFRVYTTVNNVFRISSFRNWDPELGGGSGLSYPLQRAVRLGLQVNFN